MPNNQDLLLAVVASAADFVGLLGPANPPAGELAACVRSFAKSVMSGAGYGILLTHLQQAFHLGRLCAYGV